MIKLSELNKDLYKPKDVKRLLGVSLSTVQNMTKDGRLNVVWSDTQRRHITKESLINYLDHMGLLYKEELPRQDVIYARVSTHKQKERGDLTRQIQTISTFAITQNPVNLMIIEDVGSGLNDNQKGLSKLIQMVMDDKINRIFINYKDRLTRFGFNYLKAICERHNTTIVTISNEAEDKSTQQELVEDIISLIQMYGLRHVIKEKL